MDTKERFQPLKSKPNVLKGVKPDLTTKDKGYYYSKMEFFIHESSLFLRMSGTCMPQRWLEMKDFRQYTALDVLNGAYDWGRHFEDGLFKLWNEQGLPLGWVKPLVPIVKS